MEKSLLQGNLSVIPFSHLLLRICQTEKSGYLRIKKDNSKKSLYLEKGHLTIEQSSFPEDKFLKTLIAKRHLNPSSLEKCKRYSLQNKQTLTRTLLELNIFSPSQLWKLIEAFFKAVVFPLFDWMSGEYFFDSKHLPSESEVLFRLQTLNFILLGVRQMQNYNLIEASIPKENDVIQAFKTDSINQIGLEAHELYVLNMIENEKNLKSIYNLSELGKRETQKVIFTLTSLGIIGFSKRNSKEKVPLEVSPVELDKIFDAFNNKCAYIYKYISKEIGPVALNVLEKCLEEIKVYLSPFFQKIELQNDGKFEMSSTLKRNIGSWTEKEKQSFIKDLDEILAAEVLAVKKTLGNEHESILVKNLTK